MSQSGRPAILGGQPVQPAGPPQWPPADPEVARVLEQMAADGSWGRYHGEYVPALTSQLQQFLDCEHLLLCSSGTAAVELALRGIGVGVDDEVILAGYDFRGNAGDILALGAVPVLVDVLPGTVAIDPALVERAISPATRAVLVSHLHGAVADMPRLRELADRHGLPVLEDACQMPGSTVYGRQAGLWGDVGVWSFGGSKLLSAGRGGLVYSGDAAIIQRARLYNQRGNEASPLSELQAAVLLPQLNRLAERNRLRSTRVGALGRLLQEVDGLSLLPEADSDCEPGWYKTGIWYEAESFGGLSRNQFAAAMRAEGIALDSGFTPLHRQISRRRCRLAGSLEQAERAGDNLLVLHHPVLLEPADQLQLFVQAAERIRQWSTEIIRNG